jgi:CPA2 family monovalent cation:H+ antiporter-2
MTDILLLTFLFLVSGVIAVPVATRLGLGSVLGYLIAGSVIAPLLSFLHVDVISIQHFAEFGVVMMLFLVGLELEPKMLWSMRFELLGIGGGQVVLTSIVVMGIAMLLGETWSVALVIGLIMALSSTAIVLQTLSEKGLLKSDGGKSSFSVLLFQDIAVIPMLALIPLLALPELIDTITHISTTAAEHEESSLNLVDGMSGWLTALITAGAIVIVVGAGNYLTTPIFMFIAIANLRELFVATALMMVIGIALVMSLVGLSPALGTFLAGVVLAKSEYRHELESNIAPFKGLLLGLFFMTVGAGINFSLLSDNLMSILTLTLGLIAIKVAVLYVLAVIFKIGGENRWLFSLGLAQAGEFGFVLLSFTVSNGVIPTDLADQLLLVVALSMLLTPALFILYDRVIAPRYCQTEKKEMDTVDNQSPVIIAGHGRVGGIVSRILRGLNLSPTVIDFSSDHLEILKLYGVNAYYGDATRQDLLHAAGIDEAKLFVIAIDEKEQITLLVKYLRHHYPNLHVVARATDRNHVYDLWHAGCRDIIRETYDSSLRIGRSSIEALGYSREKAERMIDEFKQLDRENMLNAAEHYDPTIPIRENDTYTGLIRENRGQWETELKTRIKAIVDEH